MSRDPRAYLWDALQAARSIQRFTLGFEALTYSQDELLQSAVERKFEIIGEALNQLSRQDPVIASRVPDLAQIIAFRNQLAHGYAKVSAGTVWTIVQTALPDLVITLQQVMDEFE
jgi:uncharacterized protein with HEPN domain